MSMAVLFMTVAVYAAGLYALAGVVACVFLHARGLGTLDHGTDGTPYFFRILITPGLIALWPLMLAKWRRIARGGEGTLNPDLPVRANTLRRIHGIAARGLAVVLPIAICAALWARSPEFVAASAGPLTESVPLPRIVSEASGAFGDLPIVLRVREDDSKARQVELDVARDLNRPALGLYWTPGSSKEPVPSAGVYLGNVWGPGARRFTLPSEAASKDGTLLIYSFVDADVIARTDLKVLSK